MINKAGSNQALFHLGRLSNAVPKQGQQTIRSKKTNNSEHPIGTIKQAELPSTLSKIYTGKDDINSVAQKVRTANKTMEAIGKHVGQMREELTTIVKNYPPYPAGSEDRVKRLKSYTSLRGLIDKLTFPPETEGAAAKILNSNNVRTNSAELNIPGLHENASHEKINAAIGNLDRAQVLLSESRNGLRTDSARLKITADNTDVFVNNDNEAETTSQEAKQQLSVNGDSISPGFKEEIVSI